MYICVCVCTVLAVHATCQQENGERLLQPDPEAYGPVYCAEGD